jgi:superkiller protein 3
MKLDFSSEPIYPPTEPSISNIKTLIYPILKLNVANAMIQCEVASTMRVLILLASTLLFSGLCSTVLGQTVRLSGPGQTARAGSDGNKLSATAAFEEGQNAQQRGDLNSAIRFYTTAIAADASLYQAYYQRATALLSLGRESDAQADFKKVIELEPKFARAHRGLGQIFLDRGQIDEAKKALALAIELEPKLTGVRIYYASALLRSGEPQRAIEHLRFAIEQKEELPLAYALAGVAEERAGKLSEAAADYARAIELDPNNATAHEGRGRLYESRGEIAKAIEDFSIAYRNAPSRELAVKLAELHTRVGQPQAAIQLYRRLLLEKPEDFAMRIEMACLMAENGQSEEAEKEIARVIALRPGDAKLLARAGDFYFKEKPSDAAEYYKRSIDADPNNNRARTQLGASLVRSLQFDQALSVLSDAIAREPDSYPAHASLATTLFKLRRYPDAAREFLWLIRSRPETSVSYYFFAISLDHLGDCEQALKSYQEFARRADPAANKMELEEAHARSGQLQRLIKERKCNLPSKKKGK